MPRSTQCLNIYYPSMLYKWYIVCNYCYPRAQASRVIGERAKRARRYLVMFMETRDIYIYIRTSVSNTHARVRVLRIN